MKRFIIVLTIVLCLASPSLADEFLGVTVIPEGTVVERNKKRLVIKTELSHEQALKFYQDSLQGLEDIKIREWKEETYIEDDGNRPWHSISISKVQERGATVTIAKDSWTWIIGTLILRYIGVFVVLLILFAGMAFSGALISRLVKKDGAKAAAT